MHPQQRRQRNGREPERLVSRGGAAEIADFLLLQARGLLEQVMQVDNAAVIRSLVEFELEDLGLIDLIRPSKKTV